MSSSPNESLSRRRFLTLTVATAGVIASGASVSVLAAPPKPKMSTPLLHVGTSTQASINIEVCGGATGAPAGFSLQWMTAAAYAANGNQWYLSEDVNLCKASFSGNANLARYTLAPGECVTVKSYSRKWCTG